MMRMPMGPAGPSIVRSSAPGWAVKPNRPPGSIAVRSHARPAGDVVSTWLICAVVAISVTLWARCSSTSSRSAGSNRLTSAVALGGGDAGAGVHALHEDVGLGRALADDVALAVHRGERQTVRHQTER